MVERPQDDEPDDADEDDEAEGSGRLSPDEAFKLLGEETRMGILRTLWAADEPLGFSELHRRVGMSDSGGFNYHLSKLVGHYVVRGEEGYELTRAGTALIGAVVADAIDQRPQFGSFAIDGECFHCGGPLQATFEEWGIIECTDCGLELMRDAFPPAGERDREPTDVARAFDRWVRSRTVLAGDDVCPVCAATLDTTIVGPDDETRNDRRPPGTDAADGPQPSVYRTVHVCTNCRHREQAPLYFHILDHPAVVSFYYQHDIDLRASPYWELRGHLREYTEDQVHADPLRVRVTIPLDDEVLRVTVDDTLSVVEVDGPQPTG